MVRIVPQTLSLKKRTPSSHRRSHTIFTLASSLSSISINTLSFWTPVKVLVHILGRTSKRCIILPPPAYLPRIAAGIIYRLLIMLHNSCHLLISKALIVTGQQSQGRLTVSFKLGAFLTQFHTGKWASPSSGGLWNLFRWYGRCYWFVWTGGVIMAATLSSGR